MKVGDLVKLRGAYGWATHRVVEGSSRCPMYAKRLTDGTLRPLEMANSQLSSYVVVESCERQTERMILGYEQHIPVLTFVMGKMKLSTVLLHANFSVEDGEGLFSMLLPSQPTFGYSPVGGVYLGSGENFTLDMQGGQTLLTGDKVSLVSFGISPGAKVKFKLLMKDEKMHHNWEANCVMD